MTSTQLPNQSHTPQISCFVEAQCTLGEGPVWDTRRDGLWWVDIVEQQIYYVDGTGQGLRQWTMPELVGFVLPRADGQLWVGLKSGLHLLSFTSPEAFQLQRVDQIDAHAPAIRFNDATYDAHGNLYVATMDMESQQPTGKVLHYVVNDDTQSAAPIPVAEDFIIANGPAVSPNGQTLYMIESEGHPGRPKGVWRAAIGTDGKLEPETHWLDWPYPGSPDGGTIDLDGNLWLGHYESRTIRQFSPTGQLLKAIDLPVYNPTKVAIDPAGRLFVTSAREKASPEQLAEYPLTGSVLMVRLT